MAKPKNANEYTKFQLFVLIYLYARMVEEGTLLERDYDQRTMMTINEFSILAPPGIVPDTDRSKRDELDELREDFLITDSGDKYFLTSSEGVTYVRRYLYYLASKVPATEDVSNVLGDTEVKEETKSWFKGIWTRVKGQSQAEIANIIVTSAKQFGSQAILQLAQAFQASGFSVN